MGGNKQGERACLQELKMMYIHTGKGCRLTWKTFFKTVTIFSGEMADNTNIMRAKSTEFSFILSHRASVVTSHTKALHFSTLKPG